MVMYMTAKIQFHFKSFVISYNRDGLKVLIVPSRCFDVDLRARPLSISVIVNTLHVLLNWKVISRNKLHKLRKRRIISRGRMICSGYVRDELYHEVG